MEPGTGTMVVGVKRKHPDDHGDPAEMDIGKEPQEQTPSSQAILCPALLRLSLDKFQLGPPNLLRQVLITNTLYHFREEMNLERGPAQLQGPREELLFPLPAQPVNNFFKELEVLRGLRATQDDGEPLDLSCRPFSAPDRLSDCKQIPSPLWASISPIVRVEEPTLGNFETVSDRYFEDLVPDNFFPNIDTSDVEMEPCSSVFAIASSSGATCTPGQSEVGWDWTELDQILEIIKGS
ncbi:SERTA domain-containing protein 3 isoform X2 [Monodelphis domestica]|uniref:SERTA domain-containing protein 3 isoform X2 n=1 Tax=Monodelphis domestica TaxID=13616 RepID=UPI0004432E40|nr:SERTA domain-containing protein 3 isoform X2 [Monodelphis domestica]